MELTRDGRAFSHRRVAAIQGGRAIMEMVCSFAIPERGLQHQMAMPEVIAPEQLRSDWQYLREIPGTVEPVTIPGPIDIRSAEPHSRSARDRGDRTDRSRMWMRADGELPDDPVVHTAVLVYSSDLTVLDPVTRPHALSMVASDVLLVAQIAQEGLIRLPPAGVDRLGHTSRTRHRRGGSADLPASQRI